MPRTPSARTISPSLGMIAGMTPFTNEFVMLDVRPAIFTGTGILNALARALFANSTSKANGAAESPRPHLSVTSSHLQSEVPTPTLCP